MYISWIHTWTRGQAGPKGHKLDIGATRLLIVKPLPDTVPDSLNLILILILMMAGASFPGGALQRVEPLSRLERGRTLCRRGGGWGDFFPFLVILLSKTGKFLEDAKFLSMFCFGPGVRWLSKKLWLTDVFPRTKESSGGRYRVQTFPPNSWPTSAERERRSVIWFYHDNDNDDDVFFSDEVTEFSITFYTTVEFEEQTDDIPLFVDTAIADMNRSWIWQ